jgi:hypothetical protein
MPRAIELPRAAHKPAARVRPKNVKALEGDHRRQDGPSEARINPELRAMLQQAAELEGRKLTEFVTSGPTGRRSPRHLRRACAQAFDRRSGDLREHSDRPARRRTGPRARVCPSPGLAGQDLSTPFR